MKRNKKILSGVFAFLLAAATVAGVNALSAKTASAASGEKLSARWIKQEAISIDPTVDADAGDFSVIVMGDQQIAIGNDKEYVSYNYDWIVENKEEMNLKMYINLGDILDVADFCDFVGGYKIEGSTERGRGEDETNRFWYQQRDYVDEQVAKLQTADIPVALVMGNHDYEDMAYNYRINKTFNQAFPLSEWKDKDYFGGSQYNDIEQAYYYFDAPNGEKFMVLVLGLYPSDEMIDWANGVLEENADRRVIVATHGYMNGKGDLDPQSYYLWDNCLSLHENVEMVFCGHNWKDGSIRKQVNYGVNGNAVHQFMVNTQGEEFGGAGVFAQLIFRANGNVDVVYRSPAIDSEEYSAELKTLPTQGQFFMAENQFTFDPHISKISVDSDNEIVVGNTIEGDALALNFAKYSSKNARWLEDVYAYKNIGILDNKGLGVKSGAGYVTYKLSAGEGYRYNQMTAFALGKLLPTANGGVSAYQVDVSSDGIDFVTAQYQNSQTGTFETTYKLGSYLRGARDLYIRILMTGDENAYLSTMDFVGTKVQTVFGVGESSMSLSVDFNALGDDAYNKYMYNSYYAYLYNEGSGAVLGTGENGCISGKAHILFRFESGENRAFDSFVFNGTMRVREVARSYYFDANEWCEEMTFGWKETDSLLALRVLVSLDGGKTYQEVQTYNNADHIGEDVKFSNDLTSYVQGKKDFIVKLQYLGSTWNNVAFKNISFTGEYDSDGIVAEPETPTYELGGGVAVENADPIKDGYAFGGWYLSSDFTGEKVNAEDYAAQGVTLYAQWLKVYRVTYVLAGGENAAKNGAILLEGQTLTLGAASKTGYSFDGWYTADKTKVTELTGDGDKVVYAAFTLNQSSAEQESGGTPTSAKTQSSSVKTNDLAMSTGCSGGISGLGVVSLGAFAAIVLKKKRK
ncbi:MAG: InlB B-repeat-containing protein [Clostridia bacterium]|nr:InlB B-repeat-containing protein [Clostridia bacterium]